MRLRGIRLYPKMIKPVAPTKHKYGADVTWSAHTDTYKPNLVGHGIDAEINAFKYNLALTTLIAPFTDEVYEKELKELVKTGRVETGIYFRPTNPLQPHVDFHNEISGKFASYWSYQGGNRQHDEFVLANALMSRISSGGVTSYERTERLSQRLATVFNYDVRDNGMGQALLNAENLLNTAIAESGWYNDFSHWHWAEDYGDKDQLAQFYDSQRTILSSVNSVTLGVCEAVEYMWLRQQFKRGGIYQKGQSIVVVCDVVNSENLPYSTVETELSVEVDVSGTILSGHDVSATSDIIKVGPDKYIVQVPYSLKDGFETVTLSISDVPSYLDLATPTIVTVSNTQSTIYVDTDKPTRAVLFAVPRGGELFQAEVVKRNHKLINKHTFTITDRNKDFYIGVITERKQSVLSAKFNF